MKCQILFSKEIICMKCQILFSRKNKKNISLSSAEFAHIKVSVNQHYFKISLKLVHHLRLHRLYVADFSFELSAQAM